MDDSITRVARAAGVPESHVARELARAIRRSEPDAREVYGVINGRRFVARRAPADGEPALAERHNYQKMRRRKSR